MWKLYEVFYKYEKNKTELQENFMKIIIFKLIMILMFVSCLIFAENQIGEKKMKTDNGGKIRLIIRADDMGFCHAANMAFKKILEEGLITSISLMVTTPWLDEAVEILKEHPEVSVGLHTALNSEWKEYRWGPVSPYDQVSSLTDEYGKFFGSRSALMANKPKVEEVAKELRAQFELVKRKGIKLDYCDNHMGAAINTLEFQEEFEKLAKEYDVGISRYFGETYMENVYTIEPKLKKQKMIEIIDSLTTPGLYLLVIHPGLDTPEMATMTDLNVTGLPNMSKHRQAEMEILCSQEFKDIIKKKNIELIGYRELKAMGLDKMKRPFDADSYYSVVEKALEQKKTAK